MLSEKCIVLVFSRLCLKHVELLLITNKSLFVASSSFLLYLRKFSSLRPYLETQFVTLCWTIDKHSFGEMLQWRPAHTGLSLCPPSYVKEMNIKFYCQRILTDQRFCKPRLGHEDSNKVTFNGSMEWLGWQSSDGVSGKLMTLGDHQLILKRSIKVVKTPENVIINN